DETGEGRTSRRGRPGPAVRADHGDPGRAGVEALRVSTGDVGPDAAAPPPAPPQKATQEASEEDVFAVAPPAVSEHVVRHDPAHDRGRLCRCGRAGAGRVLHDYFVQGGRVARVVGGNGVY